jgi:hypothetical protein
VIELRRWWGAAAASAGLELRRWRRRRVAVATGLILPVEALQRTGVDGSGLAAIAGPLAVLVAVAAGTSALGGWRLHRIAGGA